MIVFIDTNLVLDVMLENSEFYDESNDVLSYCNKGYDFYISAASCTDIFYIVRRTLHDTEETKKVMKNLLTTVSVAGVDELCIRNALNSDWKDFEDSVQYSVAYFQDVDGIITRNPKDFDKSEIEVLAPGDILVKYENKTMEKIVE